jgi:hypothetical protein
LADLGVNNEGEFLCTVEDVTDAAELVLGHLETVKSLGGVISISNSVGKTEKFRRRIGLG